MDRYIVRYVQSYRCDTNFILLNTRSVVIGRTLTPGSKSPAVDLQSARLRSLQPCNTVPVYRQKLHYQPTLPCRQEPAVKVTAELGASPNLCSTQPRKSWTRWATSHTPQKHSPMCSSCSCPLLQQVTTGALSESRDPGIWSMFFFSLCQSLPQHLHTTSTCLSLLFLN